MLATASKDLASLSGEQLAADIKREYEAAEDGLRRSARHAFNAGCLLIEAKSRLAHGEWLPWLSENFPGTRATSAKWMKLAGSLLDASEDKCKETLHLPIEKAIESLGSGPASPHVTNNSGNNEWYTPVEFLESARAVLGEIDLDPASSKTAQKNVRAKKYYTAEQDGLAKQWKGRVWLNPPYSSDLVAKFCEKLVQSAVDGDVTAAIVLCNNATETRWFEALSRVASAVCLPTGRIKYLDETGAEQNSPLQGQAFLYIGKDVKGFAEIFCAHGPTWRQAL